MFLNSLNHFRAIAIVLIVAGHCTFLASESFTTFPERLIFALVNGGTALFVFISGFLFHYIFYKRYRFKKFMSGKLKKVLLPYTLISIPVITFLLLARMGRFSEFSPGDGFISDYLVPAFRYYFTGSFAIAYWYIPFVMVVFLMSPLHMGFIKLPFKQQAWITALLFAVSLFLHRPVFNLLILQSVVYFTPVYLLGIMCSERQQALYSTFKNKEIYILLLAVLVAAIQAAIGSIGNYSKPPFAYDGIDLMLIQKVLLCLFFVVWLHRFEHVKSKAINVLASASFAVFFMHGLFIMVLEKLFESRNIAIENPLLWCTLLTVAISSICIAIASGIKKLVPDYSRYLIGY